MWLLIVLIGLQVLFWFLMGLIFYSYVLFPWWMKHIGQKEQTFMLDHTYTPTVAILMAAWNEEEILEQKLKSMLHTSYPLEKIEIWVGSDNSTDNTNNILQQFSEKYTIIHYKIFTQRTGKPQIINQLNEFCQAEILILTDADTIFSPETIPNLIAPFQQAYIGGVQAKFISLVAPNKNVGKQEVMYNDRELYIKKGESQKGAVIGAYGACYAIRRKLYVPVPKNFIVDDFFIFMKVLEQGYQTVLNKAAVCEMEISGSSEVEFKRKARIGTGNYQNLVHFKHFLNPFASFAQMAYFSHKVLRWLTPFFMILLFGINLLLAVYIELYSYLFIFQLLIYSLVVIDWFLESCKINILPIRFINHFIRMNWALLKGFFQYIKGVKKSSWENQTATPPNLK